MSTVSLAVSRPLRALINFERLLGRLLIGVVAFATIVSLLALAALSLAELTARHQLIAAVDALIAQRHSDLANMEPVAGGSDLREDSLRRELGRYQRVRFQTQLLIASGGLTHDDEVFALRSHLMDRVVTTEGVFEIRMLREVRLLPNAMLTMLLLAVCGAIGTAVSAARRKSSFTLSDAGVGLAAGFITFLAISGGKDVFLLQSSDIGVVFNPYSSALFALLAGLFTQRAYRLLGMIVDSLSTRIEESLRTPSSNAVPGQAEVHRE